MFFNTIVSVFGSKNSLEKKSNKSQARDKHISQKYYERSIINRYFK